MLHANPVLEYDYRNWTSNHVWLHKPPLALRIQAASMRVFGVNEWAMRLPSVLFSTGAVVATYAIGRAVISPPAGLVAAAFHAVHGFSVDLAAGRRATDHVDTLLLLLSRQVSFWPLWRCDSARVWPGSYSVQRSGSHI